MRFTLRFALAVLILLVLPFGYLKFAQAPFGDTLAQQFLAQAEEVYAQTPDGILYEKVEQVSVYRGNDYHQIIETWIAPDGSTRGESRSVDGEDNEMSWMAISIPDERGVTYHYGEDYAGPVPQENPFCIFTDEDNEYYYRMEMEIDGSDRPGFGGYTSDKNFSEKDLDAVDAFYMAFRGEGNSREKAQDIIETLKENPEWSFVEKDDKDGHFYVFSASNSYVNIDVIFDAASSKITEITTTQTGADQVGDFDTTRYIEQAILPLEGYDEVFNTERSNLALVDISPVALPENVEEGCYSIDGKKLSEEESEALLSTLKEGYLEESLAEFMNPPPASSRD